jgi:hypothetical protein
MSWPSGFRDKLYSGGVVRLALIFEIVRPFNGNGEGVGVAGWKAASDPGMGADAELLLEPLPDLGTTGVRPQDWTYQEGAWSVTLHIPDSTVSIAGVPRSITDAARYAARALKRGALCRLLVGEVGADYTDYQPLKLGRVYQVSHSGGPFLLKVEAWDLMSGLRSRLASSGAAADEKARLFYGSASQLDLLASAYTPADGTLTLSGATADRFLLEAGGSGAVAVVDDGALTFYLTYTGTGTSTLTGCSSTGQFGTAAGAAAIGNLVTSLVLLEGHPARILQRLLTSTGTGSNGSQDTYPRAWSLGIPHWMVDEDEFRAWTVKMNITGTYEWRILQAVEQEDPAAWIAAVFSPAGIWACTREGELVIRAARDPNNAGLLLDGPAITDADLAGPPRMVWYPDDVPMVYHKSTVTDSSGSSTSTSNVTCLPAREVYTHDLSGVLVSVTDAADIRTETRDRLKAWDHFVPEYLELPLTGLRSYAPGDVIEVTCAEVRGRFDGTLGGYDKRPCMVVRESMGWESSHITVAALPTSITEEPT